MEVPVDVLPRVFGVAPRIRDKFGKGLLRA
jgi:hypothetical protein